MNESSLPPNFAEPPVPRQFPRYLATFSILTPVVVVLIVILEFMGVKSHGANPSRFKILGIIALFQIALLALGFCLGIITLVLLRRHEREGVLGKAVVGTCVNGLLVLLVLFGPLYFALKYQSHSPTTPQGRLDEALKKLAAASSEEDEFYALDDAAKQSFEVGKMEDARKYAKGLLSLAPYYTGNWNYGNAIQDGNLILGRIALKEGHLEEAKQYLLEEGKSPGSPQMDSFGPNMSLARDLLEKGERETVLQYFDLCRRFWKMGQGELDEWTKDVKAGQIPDFGANLVY